MGVFAERAKEKKTNQIVCKRIREASKQLKKKISFSDT